MIVRRISAEVYLLSLCLHWLRTYVPLQAGSFQCDSGISSCWLPGAAQDVPLLSDGGGRDAGLLTGTVNESSVFVCACSDHRFSGMYACLHEGGRWYQLHTHTFDSFGSRIQSRVCCSGLTGLLFHLRTWKLGPVQSC